MKFIIADDDERFRKYLREFITKEGDECIELDDGIKVSSVYKEFCPDWVLLDILMKNVSGFKAAEQLKKNFPEARIVIISSYSDERFRKKAKKVGAVTFVSKENLFDLKEFIYPDVL